MPTKEDLFGPGLSSTEYGDRLELLKGSLSKSIKRHDAGSDRFLPRDEANRLGVAPGIQRGIGNFDPSAFAAFADRVNGFTKGLSADEQAQVLAEFSALQGMAGEFGKDISSTVPGNLHPYDLEAPAKILVPRFTPLRNRMTRTRGQGTAREYRRILGYTNTGMGGVADQLPFFASETALNSGSTTGLPYFGALQLIRGQKISYAMDVHTVSYVEMSLSDSVGTKAYWSDLGFEDVRQLSQMALLWAQLLGEEKALLYSRGASTLGYAGAVSAPVVTATTGTGGALTAATYYVKVTARSGGGESVTSTEVSQAITGTQSLVVNVGTEPVGALSYNLYVGTAAGAETFQEAFVGNSVTLATYVTGGAAPPTGDSTVTNGGTGYDGYLTVLSNPSLSGYVNRLNAPLWNGSTGGGDAAFQNAFASLYASVYADPEEIWLTAAARRELADWLKTEAGGATGYRLMMSQGEFESGTHISGVVTGIVNESSPTNRILDLMVHPYMPAGASFVNSRVLPIPDSHVGQSAEVIEVVPLMSCDWPQIQFTWDASTYWLGTMVHYAPKWSAAILGIQ